MSDLTRFRDHAHERANWQPGDLKAACRDRTAFGTPKPADHANCGGCGCTCHAPTDRERALWVRLAAEVDAYLDPQSDLFGEKSVEPTTTRESGRCLTRNH